MRKNLIAWMKSFDFKKCKSDTISVEISDKEDIPVYRRLRGSISIRTLKIETFLNSITVYLDSDSSRKVYNYNVHYDNGLVSAPRILKKDLFVILDSNKFLEVE